MKIRIATVHPSTGVQSVHSRYNQCFSILLQLGCERMTMERLRRRGCDPKLLRCANAPEFQLAIIFNEKVLSTRNELWFRATEGPRFVCNDVWLDAQCRDIDDVRSASTRPDERSGQGVDDTRLDVGRWEEINLLVRRKARGMRNIEAGEQGEPYRSSVN